MKYCDGANTFLIGENNFYPVYQDVSKGILFILVSETVVWCEGEAVTSSMYSSSEVSIRFRFLFACPYQLFASFRFACPFAQLSNLV